MTITIEASDSVAQAIAQKAARVGLSVPDYVLRAATEKDVSSTKPDYDYTDALFDQWEADHPVTGPEDLAERQRAGDEITAAIQENRFNIGRDPELVAIEKA